MGITLAAEAAVKVTDYAKAYGEKLAVKQVSFTVAKNEIFGLLGPNGAGKTTILESLVGLRSATSGNVRVNGYDPFSQRDKVLAHIGIQPQEASLFPNLKVVETLELFASLYERPRPVDEIMHVVGLEEKAKMPVKKLSGGQKQRLLIAVALIADPDILLLDEPTSSLDPQARRYIWSVIQDMKKRGRSVILTTHSMEEAHALCDRIAILDDGRIIAEGPPNELIYRYFPKQRLIFEVNAVPVLDFLREFSEVEDISTFCSEDGSYEIRLTTTPLTREVLHSLVNQPALAELNWKKIRVESGTLEDVFLRLTGKSIREGK